MLRHSKASKLNTANRLAWRTPSAIVLFAASLTACVAGPDYVRPAAPQFADYTEGTLVESDRQLGSDGVSEQRLLIGRDAATGWWDWFGSPALTDLVERAFDENPSAAAAQARLDRARSILAAQRGLRSPILSAEGSASYGSGGVGSGSANGRRSAADGTGGVDMDTGDGDGTAGGDTSTDADGTDDDPTGDDQDSGGVDATEGDGDFAVYTAAAVVSYDLDLFGRNRRTVEAATRQLDVRQQETQAAYLALAGNVVAAALDAAALDAQLKARAELIEAQQERIGLIEIRVEEGAQSRSELLPLVADLAALQATLPPLQADLAAARHRLSALIGAPPSQSDLPDFTLDEFSLPEAVPIALPARLVRTRPDILAAEAFLAQASANVGIRTAELYPNVVLDAGFGVAGTSQGGGLDTFYDVGAGLFAPIFSGGRLRALRDAEVATYDEALALYREQVLSALVEVADGIRAVEAGADAEAAQRIALDAAFESYDLAVFQLEEGAISPIELSVALSRYQEARFAYIDVLAGRLQDTASLLAAVGTGPLSQDDLGAVISGERIAMTRDRLSSGEAPSAVATR